MARSWAMTHLPRCPAIHVEFQDVTYDVAQAGSSGRKTVLHGISGKFMSGELTAILGPSGAGKSSLLNILTGFRTAGAGGSIMGQPVDRRMEQLFRKQSRYIMQEDKLCPLFTVVEIMHVAVNCKLSRRHSARAKQLVVNGILEVMGLESSKETHCGNLSGGQTKRLSIALELLDNPPVVFLDEPTTGLDSSSTLQVISVLKTLARGGRNIVCTIHQPCSKVLSMFDHVYVVSEGRCIYQGSSDNIVPFLSSVGLNCPQYHNPADYIIEVASGEHGHFTDQLVEATKLTCWRKPCEDIEGIQLELGGSKSNYEARLDESPPSELEKFPILLNRCFLQLYRDWTVTHLKCIIHLCVGLVIGGIYHNIGSDASKTFSNFGFIMITITYLMFSTMMPSILRFPSELAILKREKFNNWYCLTTYYLAVLVSSVPVQILYCVIYISVTYFLTAQPLAWSRFTMFLIVCVITLLIGDSLGQLFGTLFDPVNGTFLGSVLLCFMALLSGFICLLRDMPVYLYYLTYGSALRYSLAGLALSVYDYGRDPLDCPPGEVYCHLRHPRMILREFDAPEGQYWPSVGVLVLYLLVFRATTFYSLRARVKSR